MHVYRWTEYILEHRQREFLLPVGGVWLWFVWESTESSSVVWEGKEITGESAIAFSRVVVVCSRDEKPNESVKKRRKARPTKRHDTANVRKTWWLCFCRDKNGLKSHRIPLTISCVTQKIWVCAKNGSLEQRRGHVSYFLESNQTVLWGVY